MYCSHCLALCINGRFSSVVTLVSKQHSTPVMARQSVPILRSTNIHVPYSITSKVITSTLLNNSENKKGLMKGNYSLFTAVTVDANHLVLWVEQGAGQEH